MTEKELRSLLARYGLRTSKSLGQNFLIGDEIPGFVADSAGLTKQTHVLEIGPGTGAMTRFLCERAGFVTAVELDAKLTAALTETLAGAGNIEIIRGDILKTNLAELMSRGYGDLRVCANLPYNITSPVLAMLFASRLFASITVMVQREVALRLAAKPGTPDYGSFTLLTRYNADVSLLRDVPPTAFLPPPQVTSTVIRLDTHAPPDCVRDEKLFFRTVRASFAQRRKTLANALSAGFAELSKPEIEAAIAECGLPPLVRGETLSLEAFAGLADRLSARLG